MLYWTGLQRMTGKEMGGERRDDMQLRAVGWNQTRAAAERDHLRTLIGMYHIDRLYPASGPWGPSSSLP